MPTGYTAALYDGEQSFEDYALGVARGFGALITMRDDPPDAEIPAVFEPASYYVNRLAEAQAELDAVSNASNARLAERQDAEIRKSAAYRDQHLRERDERRARYEAMLRRARAFVPPTPEHEDLKATMVEQLERSINFDCGGSYVPAVPDRLPIAEYRAGAVAAARAALERAAAALAKEDDRAEGRTRWVQALRDALAAAPDPPEPSNVGGEPPAAGDEPGSVAA